GKKVLPVCTRDDGRLMLHNAIAVASRTEGLNAHSFRHTHAKITKRNSRNFYQKSADKVTLQTDCRHLQV
ncbi:MAG: hypothetical protein IJ685_03840, partial [Selenomonadaceae bacterium]|nr:hypothetical protein [Selenomonadaceae bacterium]